MQNNEANEDKLRCPLIDVAMLKSTFVTQSLQLIAKFPENGQHINVIQTTIQRSESPLLPISKVIHHANEVATKILILAASKPEESDDGFQKFKTKFLKKVDEIRLKKWPSGNNHPHSQGKFNIWVKFFMAELNTMSATAQRYRLWLKSVREVLEVWIRIDNAHKRPTERFNWVYDFYVRLDRKIKFER